MTLSKLTSTDVHCRGTRRRRAKGRAAGRRTPHRVEGQVADSAAAEPARGPPAKTATTPPNLAEVRATDSPSAGPTGVRAVGKGGQGSPSMAKVAGLFARAQEGRSK